MPFVKITSMSFKYKGPTDYTFIWIFKRGHSLHWPRNFIYATNLVWNEEKISYSPIVGCPILL